MLETSNKYLRSDSCACLPVGQLPYIPLVYCIYAADFNAEGTAFAHRDPQCAQPTIGTDDSTASAYSINFSDINAELFKS